MKRKASDHDGDVAYIAETEANARVGVVEGEGLVLVDNSAVPMGAVRVGVAAAGTLEEEANVMQDFVSEQSPAQLPSEDRQTQPSNAKEDHKHSLTQQYQQHQPKQREQQPKMKLFQGGGAEWNAMLFQLVHYKAIHGDLRPKSKDDESKPLHEWMVAQRKEFKIYQETPEKSNLTADQLKVLDHLQFPWNTRGDEHWSRNYEHLKQFRRDHGHCMVPRTFVDVPNLCHWVTDQRRQLKNLKSGRPSTMTKDRQRLLDEIDFVWQVRNRTTWDTRFAELVDFNKQKGTTVVPQHYTTNKALGKWVAKQREQFKLLKNGEHSFLTPDRLEQLNSIRFVWSMKGRTPKEEDEIEDAAIAAAKAAVAAAVAAEDAAAGQAESRHLHHSPQHDGIHQAHHNQHSKVASTRPPLHDTAQPFHGHLTHEVDQSQHQYIHHNHVVNVAAEAQTEDLPIPKLEMPPNGNVSSIIEETLPGSEHQVTV
mmetsp:Transcript_22232/g.32817  ORF Transcript_22232/g.32817 Transcript_22232/m.32817 type:complete len:479 (-) Transcript_22232:439-1875(-)